MSAILACGKWWLKEHEGVQDCPQLHIELETRIPQLPTPKFYVDVLLNALGTHELNQTKGKQ